MFILGLQSAKCEGRSYSSWSTCFLFFDLEGSSSEWMLGSTCRVWSEQVETNEEAYTALGDDDGPEQLVELLVVADGELQVARDDAGLLVVAGGLT
jgi:hypothetical protein